VPPFLAAISHRPIAGQMGFQRQLTADEIVEQVTRFSTYLKSVSADGTSNANGAPHSKHQRLSNVVFMGEGEPLANFRNVMEAVPRIQKLAGIGARKITISTVGVVPNIRKLMSSPIQVRLAVSLHCASDEERSALLPANKRYGGLNELMTTLHEYIETTGRRLTLEWALIEGENDTPEVARQLGNLLRKYKLRRDMVHVNVIPLNPTGGYKGSASGKKRVNEFVRILVEDFGVACTPRVRRGIDIDAGCGQLKSKELAEVEELKLRVAENLDAFSVGSATLDLDSDTAVGDEDGEIIDETFDSSDAVRLISLVKGTVIKDDCE
jgi:23S rRNA (adenine2503-C2)-methyltransferase